MPDDHISLLDAVVYVLYNARMEQKNYVNVRVRKETQYTLKIVAALCQESMLETLARLVQQEYERLQQEGGKRNAALQKDQA